MGMGTLTLLGMLCTPGQMPADVTTWTSPSMKIPIDYHPSKRAEIKELLLFVSPDQGVTWNSVAVADPARDTQFTFNAQADGLYWFNMVVVNKSGTREPADVTKGPPALKVLFDTKKPVVAITGAQRVGDDVTVAWKVTEKNPDWSKFKVEYRLNNGPPVPVPTRPEADGSSQFKVTGAGDLRVGVSITDLAGHTAEAQSPVAGTVAAKPADPIITTGGAGEVAGGPAIPGVAAPPGPGTPLPTMPPMPPVERAKDLRNPTEPRGADTPVAPAGFPPPPGAPGAPPIMPPTGDSFISPPPAVPTGPKTEPVGVSPPAPAAHLPPPQVINVTSFKMAYEVEDRGASGVAKAEVHVTRDEGRTWQLWQTFDKPDASLLVNLVKPQSTAPVEGIYGFKVVLQSGAGLSREAPRPGDAPDLRLDVDVTAPVVKIYEPGPDPAQKDTMILKWQAVDRNLATDPITLEWSSDGPKGPWFPVAGADGIGSSHGIARRLPNTGSYAWKLPTNFPTHKVYLRVTARDVAGNVAEATTAQPILVDLNKPTAVKLNIIGGGR
jgi:hypothetical protein